MIVVNNTGKMTNMYAEILLPQKIGSDKETLTYKVPETKTLEIGQLVNVNLRKKTVFGIVFALNEATPPFKTLEISEILDQKPIISQKQLEFIQWMSKYYFCPIHKLIKYFIPKRVFQNKPLPSKLSKKTIRSTKSCSKILNNEQQEAFNSIINSPENKFLIHGVTGSGKTELYTHLASRCINN